MNNSLNEEIALLLQNIGVEKSDINWGTQLTLLAVILIITYLCTKAFRHIITYPQYNSTHQSKMGRLSVQF